MLLTSFCNSTVAIGASNCPLATTIWNSSGRPSFNIVCGASNRFFQKSASGMAPIKAPASMSPSYSSPRNPLENIASNAYFFTVSLLIVGETFWVCLVLPGAVVKIGHQWLLFAFVGFVVSTESLVKLMYQVKLDLQFTNLSMLIVVRLTHVPP